MRLLLVVLLLGAAQGGVGPDDTNVTEVMKESKRLAPGPEASKLAVVSNGDTKASTGVATNGESNFTAANKLVNVGSATKMSNTVVIVDTAETENATDTSDLCNNTAATEVPQESEQVNKTESEQEVPQATDGSVGDANATEVSSAPMVPSSIAIITPATILPKQSFGSTADGDAPALTEREGPKSTVALDDGQITNNGEQASEKTIEKKKEKKSDGTSRKERISELLEAVSNLAAVTGTNEVTENMAADNATDASASSGSSDSTDAATDSAAGTANTEGTPAASTAVEAEVSSTTTVSEGQTRIPVVKVSDVDVTSKASISAEKTSENVSEKVPAKEASQMTAVKTSGVRDNEVPKKKISSSIATTVTPEIATLKVLGAGASEGVIQQATKAPKQFFGAPVDAKAIHIVGKELSTSATVSGGESTNLNEQVSEKEKSEKEIENSESLVGAGSTTPPVSGVDATAMEKIVSKSADVAAGESSAKVSKVQVNAKASEDTIAKGKKTKKKKKRKEKGPEEKKVGVVGSIAADDSPEVTSIPAKMDSSALPPSKTMRAVGYEAKAAATATKKLAFGSLSLKLPEVEVGTAKPLSPSAGSKPKVVVAKSSFETPAPAAAVTSVVSENLRIAALSGSKVGAPKVSGAKAGAAAVSGGQLEAPLNHDGLTNDLKKGKANDGDVENTLHPDERESEVVEVEDKEDHADGSRQEAKKFKPPVTDKLEPAGRKSGATKWKRVDASDDQSSGGYGFLLFLAIVGGCCYGGVKIKQIAYEQHPISFVSMRKHHRLHVRADIETPDMRFAKPPRRPMGREGPGSIKHIKGKNK